LMSPLQARWCACQDSPHAGRFGPISWPLVPLWGIGRLNLALAVAYVAWGFVHALLSGLTARPVDAIRDTWLGGRVLSAAGEGRGRMRIAIATFSGTGNTAWVVDCLTQRLTALGDEVSDVAIERSPTGTLDANACDVLGLAFPVHASFAPKIVRDFIAGLPPTTGKPLFAVTTAGYVAGDTAWYAIRALTAKGYEPFVLANVIVANNLRLPVLSPLPIPSPEEMEPRLGRAARKAHRIADWVHQGERHVEGTGLFGRMLGVSQRLLAAPLEALAFQGFFADESCIRCGWCVRHCPVGNIEMTEQGVRFLEHCILCMRCYSFCPEQAIQSTERTQNTERWPRYQGPKGKPYPEPR